MLGNLAEVTALRDLYQQRFGLRLRRRFCSSDGWWGRRSANVTVAGRLGRLPDFSRPLLICSLTGTGTTFPPATFEEFLPKRVSSRRSFISASQEAPTRRLEGLREFGVGLELTSNALRLRVRRSGHQD
jgi:hypothetical protein